MHKVFLLTIALLFSLPQMGLAQEESGKRKKIRILDAETGYYNRDSDMNRLVGHVIFEHDGALMYCDSAWLYGKENRLKAFQNVRLNQGDTIFLNGDYLEYSGETKKALTTGEVVTLRDKEMLLVTDRVDFDRSSNIAYYTTGGVITNDENELVSKRGTYSTTSKVFNFKDSVVLTNPDYVIESDTLIYNSDTRIAYFHGPTTITSDSSYIYCENGKYNTIKDVAQFEKNALLYDDNRYLTGDSLYYEKKFEFGEAFKNVRLHDTVNNSIITGDYGRYLGQFDSAFVTLEPMYSVVEDSDTLFIHGDTIMSSTRKDSIDEYRLVKVFHAVRFFKSDMQGQCDSLTYFTGDSTFRMYDNPIIWNDSTQITGDTIYMLMANDKPDSLKVFNNAFMISQDLENYNQVKGKKMRGKFNKEGELARVFVDGNGQTVYYPKEEDGSYIGMNKSICSNMIIKFQKSELRSITFLKKPDATLYPIEKVPGGENRLEGFNPHFELRPLKKEDIFLDVKNSTKTITKTAETASDSISEIRTAPKPSLPKPEEKKPTNDKEKSNPLRIDKSKGTKPEPSDTLQTKTE